MSNDKFIDKLRREMIANQQTFGERDMDTFEGKIFLSCIAFDEWLQGGLIMRLASSSKKSWGKRHPRSIFKFASNSPAIRWTASKLGGTSKKCMSLYRFYELAEMWPGLLFIPKSYVRNTVKIERYLASNANDEIFHDGRLYEWIKNYKNN